MLAICALISNGNSGKVLTNTIQANDIYSFYQAKSIKQSIAEQTREDLANQLATNEELSAATRARFAKRISDLDATIARYESDPKSGEGKRELLATAKALEADRDAAKAKGPYFSFSSALLQIAIVLSSTAILGVSMELLWASVGCAAFSSVLFAVGYFLILL